MAETRRRRRGRLRFWAAAPWRRAPLLLRDEPRVVAALLVAMVVLTVASTSAPLFLATTGSAALARTVAAQCPEAALPTVQNPILTYQREGVFARSNSTQGYVAADAQIRAGDDLVRDRMDRAGLPAPQLVLTASAPVGGGDTVTLFSRPGALDHVDIVAGADAGPGAWISDRYAGVAGLVVGDRLQLSTGALPVAGIYREFAGDGFHAVLPRYWCTWSSLLVATIDSRPPPFVIVDEPGLRAHSTEIGATWYSQVDVGALTVPEAWVLASRTGEVERGLRGVNSTLATQYPYSFNPGFAVSGHLGADADRADLLRSGVGPPVIPVAVAGTLVAFLLVAGAGVFWAERRRAELRLLTSRGVGPAAVGVKAVLEVLPAVVVGTALGWLVTVSAIRAFGPSALFEPGGLRRSLAVAAVTAGAGVIVLGAVAARQSLESERRHRLGTRLLAVVPWELCLVGAAVWLGAGADPGRPGGLISGVAHVRAATIAFPLLALSGVVLFGARVGYLVLPWLRSRTRDLRPPGYLAAGRITGARLVSAGLLVLTAVPVGVFVYAQSVTDTTAATLAAKAGAYAGSANSLRLAVPPGTDAHVDGLGTLVSVISDGRSDRGTVQVLGVDPATFATYADRRLLDDAAVTGLADLGPAGADGRVPALWVSPGDAEPAVTELALRRSTLQVDVVAELPVFPGMRLLRQPVLVVDRTALVDVDPYTQRTEEVWTTDADLSAAAAALDVQGIVVRRTTSPDTLLTATDLVTVTWSFGYLRALAALTGLIAVTGLLLYLSARARSRQASYVMARRMGLTRGGHVRSLAVELTVLLGAGWCTGVVVGSAALLVAAGSLDVDPTFPPPPVVAVPWAVLGWSLLAAVAVVLLGTATAQRSADRLPAAGVLRLGG